MNDTYIVAYTGGNYLVLKLETDGMYWNFARSDTPASALMIVAALNKGVTA